MNTVLLVLAHDVGVERRYDCCWVHCNSL